MQPASILHEIHSCGLDREGTKDLLLILMHCAARVGGDGHAVLRASELEGLTGRSHRELLKLLDVAVDHRMLIVKEPREKQRTLFDDDSPLLSITILRWTALFGSNKPVQERNPFRRASFRMNRELPKRMERTEAERVKPTSEMIETLWKWWGHVYTATSRSVMGKEMLYVPTYNLDQDLNYIAEMAAIPSEVVLRAGKAVLFLETAKWVEPSNGKLWYWAGKRTVRAWFEACKRLMSEAGQLQRLRREALVDRVTDMQDSGSIDFGSAVLVLQMLAKGEDHKAVQFLRANEIYVDLETVGLERYEPEREEREDEEAGGAGDII